MRIFKFGGASVRDAENIINVANIIERFKTSSEQLIVVISALGKTTNHLEIIAKALIEKSNQCDEEINRVFDLHFKIIDKLKLINSEPLRDEMYALKKQMEAFVISNESDNYNYIYDQIVSKGEILSTTIVYHYLKGRNNDVTYINAKNLIKTDSNYTDANIDWVNTKLSVQETLNKISSPIMITQGFIGANSEMLYTTLGREGSDYTAAILANCTDTKELTIWKDVDGVYTADPKKFPDTTLVPKLSYKEAIEMTFYGAQIIHPKTIKPIQNSSCILKVKSFLHLDAPGTEIGNFEQVEYQPAIVLKENQVLYAFSVKDYSFLNENNLGKIIASFGKYSLRINLMQNAAIEFMVVTDEKLGKNELIIEDLGTDFEIKVRTDLKLMTIRHYSEEILENQRKNKAVILTQKGLDTIHYLMN